MPLSGHLTQQVQTLGNFVLDLLFPWRCAGCRRLGEGLLCAGCIDSFAPLGDMVCPICGSPDGNKFLCQRCAQERPAFEYVRGAFRFEDPLRQAIHALKYDGLRQLATPLAIIASRFLPAPSPDTMLCPVPLHAQREARRGFNQAALLAESLSGIWGMALAPSELLTRIRQTESQVGQNWSARQQNMNGAFIADATLAAGRRVVLVDDVCTTGATLNACAIALLQAGAEAVAGITLARA